MTDGLLARLVCGIAGEVRGCFGLGAGWRFGTFGAGGGRGGR